MAADIARIKKDGERLQAALNEMGLSQAEVARLTGIRQSWINDAANGTRALGREDLRRLGKIGISPEYILGLSDTLYRPGGTRTRTAIENDLAREVAAELSKRYPPIVPGARAGYQWRVSGPKALRAAVDAMSREAERALHDERERVSLLKDMDALHDALDLLTANEKVLVDATAAKTALRITKVWGRLIDRAKSVSVSELTSVLLAPETTLAEVES